MAIEEKLVSHLEQFHSLPFLFVGSGLSRRYLNSETWEDLLRRFSGETRHPFEYYLSAADSDLPQAATRLAEEFHEVWWHDEKFEAARAKSKGVATRKDSPLKIEISRYLSELDSLRRPPASMLREIELFKKIQVDGIITTNWDRLLERLMPGFHVFVGQEELLFSNPQGIAEIYKIHGCCERPNSLVLTSSDYEHFKNRNPYLAAKLLSIFVEHPVVFLGYSLADKNIAEILASLLDCMEEQHLAKLRDRLIFVEWSPEARVSEFTSTVMQIQGKPLPITLIRSHTFLPIFSALSKPRRRYPARILRQLKESVYELVRQNDPAGQLFVTDIESAPASAKFDVVYGVGLIDRLGKKGYVALTADDIRRDVVHDNQEFDAAMVVEHVLPGLLVPTRNVPVFSYLNRSGLLRADGSLSGDVPELVEAASKRKVQDFWPSKQYRKMKSEVRKLGSIEQIVAGFGVKKATALIPLLGADLIDLEELEVFLLDNWRLLTERNNLQTNMRKLVCVYDFLKFGPETLTQ